MDPGDGKPWFRPLPNGWGYAIQRRDARALAAELSPQLVRIEFTGTGRKPSRATSTFGDSYCAGALEARATAAGWRFRLEMRGIPIAVIGEDAASLRSAILDAVRQFCAECRQQDPDPTSTPVELRFFLRHRDGVLRPAFSRWNLEGWDEIERRARDPWWT